MWLLWIILMYILHFFFANITCCLFCIYFRLGKWCYIKCKFELFSYMSSKWVIKYWRQLATSAVYLTHKLIMNVQCSGGSRSFAKEMSTLKMRSIVSSHWKLTRPTESKHWSWSSFNYTRSCWTQCWPFYGCSAFEANWEGEKAWKVGASWADWK